MTYATTQPVPAGATESIPDADFEPSVQHEGHGRRLLAAIAALDGFPAQEDARDRLLALASAEQPSAAALAAAVEADVALTLAVLRRANAQGPDRGRIESAGAAVRALGPQLLCELAQATPTFDFFQRAGAWGATPVAFRLEALAVQRTADRIAAEIDYEHRDRLAVASLLHDVGRLVLARAFPGVARDEDAPASIVLLERRELGVDHATVGGVVARRLGLPRAVSDAIAQHHSVDATGDAAIVKLAVCLARYARGRAVDMEELRTAAAAACVSEAGLRRIMRDLPCEGAARPRGLDTCPLSRRELAALKGLANGWVYKQIGGELGISVSTVRTHLFNTYRKLGAHDRAQAVLIATSNGWI